MAQPDSYELLPVHAAGGSEDENVLQSTLGNENAPSAAPLREDRDVVTADLSHIPSLRACGCSDKNGRRLVVCVDGTSNQFGKKNTNVIELYRLIKKKKGDNQLTYYNSGIGTYATPSSKTLAYYKRLFGHKIDLAIAWNFERIIIDAYRWLSENYEDGDCIFLFGFSRGAYQVRVLSAMIRKVRVHPILFVANAYWMLNAKNLQVGLIHRGNEAQIPFAYQLYADPDSDNDPPPVSRPRDPEESPLPAYSPAKTFKNTFSREVTVHFVGVWDTVSSIGVVRARKLLPETIDGMTHVCFFRHALALDERRVKFLPEYANGGAGPPQPQPDPEKSGPHTKEVWFAGTHSDVGGGTEENPNLDKTRPSLRWMFSEASAAGLHLDSFNRAYKDEEAIDVHESLTFSWRAFERLPFRRLTYNEGRADARWVDNRWIFLESLAWCLWELAEVLILLLWFLLKLGTLDWRALRSIWRANSLKDTISWPPHRGKGRVIQVGQKIHTSVWRLKNLDIDIDIPDTVDALTLRAHSTPKNPVYAASIGAIHSFLSSRRNLKSKYTPRAHLVGSDKKFWGNLRQPKEIGTSVGPKDDSWRSWKEVDLYDSIEDLIKQYTDRQQADPDDDAQRTQLAMMQIHANSLNGRRVLLGELIKQLGAGKLIQHDIFCNILKVIVTSSEPQPGIGCYETTRAYVLSHLMDGRRRNDQDMKCFVSAITDSLKRMKDILEEHDYVIDDAEQRAQLRAIRVYTILDRRALFYKMAKQLREGVVQADIFRDVLDALVESADPSSEVQVDLPYRFIRSQMLRHLTGDSEIQQQIAKQVLERCAKVTTTVRVLTGHTEPVSSVAFSPDGTRIVSGSWDDTIRIWNAETGQEVGEPLKEHARALKGHTNYVYSVAFSPDGTRIVSGSQDRTIRVWNAETGQAVGMPLKGHTDFVYSVAFSPDGTRIVSGSRDNTVWVWNAETGQVVGKSLEGHTDSVLSVAFSPDGTRIVSGSGSGDKTIRIWDAETGQAVGEPLEGHTDFVRSVAFSPDGARIVSGSGDKTIRIWDAETGEVVGKPLEGHTGSVRSVAYSRNGTRIVSGSGDKTIRIWDAETGQAVGKPLEGHTDWVMSVAFSPDGARIVSGSDDKTVRIWDVLQEPV